MFNYKRLIDISQPVNSRSAVFPGDTPYKREIVLSFEQSKVINLSSFTMSPHIGTHVDAPAHIKGDMSVASELVGNLPLDPFIGPVLVIDLAPHNSGISIDCVDSKISKLLNAEDKAETPARSAHAIMRSDEDAGAESGLPPRLLFRTQQKIRYDVFEDSYAYFTKELVQSLHSRGVRLMGIDTPSADHVESKTLDAHHELDRLGMTGLENLDLCHVREGRYCLVAFPLKLIELEASPVRAVLLEF